MHPSVLPASTTHFSHAVAYAKASFFCSTCVFKTGQTQKWPKWLKRALLRLDAALDEEEALELGDPFLELVVRHPKTMSFLSNANLKSLLFEPRSRAGGNLAQKSAPGP